VAFLNWLESSFPEAKSIGSVIANSHPQPEFSEAENLFALRIVDTLRRCVRCPWPLCASLHDDGGTRKPEGSRRSRSSLDYMLVAESLQAGSNPLFPLALSS
jgi:hypothetical protein